MKKYFKKSLAVFMAMLMLLSVMSVSVFAASYTIQFLPGRYATGTGPDPITVEKGTVITLPGASFTREGYDQTGWSTSQSGSKKNYELNDSYTVTKAAKLYPYWEASKLEVTFAPGANGVGIPVIEDVEYDETVKFPGAVFTRDGYIQIGWSTVDGGEVEFGLTATTPAIVENITFYPVWEKCVYDVDASISSYSFGNTCEDYAAPNAATLVITNEGNMTLDYTLPSSSAYSFVVKSGSLNLQAGKSVTIEIKPLAGLDAADYSANLVFDCDTDDCDVKLAVTFKVSEHSFDRYVSNNDATYDADGTKSAECSNGCGLVDIIADKGSKKIYSPKNNTVDGLLEEYLFHKTIRVNVFGSGMDNIQPDGSIAFGTKRYRPVSWYVDEQFNGEFKDDNYEINFVHTSYGDYTLKVSYIEEVYTCNNPTGPINFCEVCGELTDEICEFCGAETLAIVCDLCGDPNCGNALYEDESEKTFGWVETGVKDEKSFDYYVAPNEKEQEDIEEPSPVLEIFKGIFEQILNFFKSLFGIN